MFRGQWNNDFSLFSHLSPLSNCDNFTDYFTFHVANDYYKYFYKKSISTLLKNMML